MKEFLNGNPTLFIIVSFTPTILILCYAMWNFALSKYYILKYAKENNSEYISFKNLAWINSLTGEVGEKAKLHVRKGFIAGVLFMLSMPIGAGILIMLLQTFF